MVMKYKFFKLHFKDDDGAVAKAADDFKFPTDYENLETFVFSFEKPPQDFLANDLGWPLLSERMKKIISEFSDETFLTWKVVEIKNNDLIYKYFLPIFKQELDVLDLEKSIVVRDFVVKPHLSLKKVINLAVFKIPKSEVGLIVNDVLLKELKLSKLSGLDYSPCPAS